MLIKDNAWTATFAMKPLLYRGLNYSVPFTMDAIEDRFYKLCNRYGIHCEWYPFAGAIDVAPGVDIKFLGVLRSHAIDAVKESLRAVGYRGTINYKELTNEPVL